MSDSDLDCKTSDLIFYVSLNVELSYKDEYVVQTALPNNYYMF